MLTIHGGRTRRLWNALLGHVAVSRGAGRKCVLLVPEQYTLQAERSLIAGLGIEGFFDIEALSLSRFTQRLLSLNNREGGARVDAVGKSIAVAQAVASCEKELRYYARAAARQGFIQQAAAWIADMKRAGITPQKLLDYAQSLPEGARRDKLSDLAAVYGAYCARTAGTLSDDEDILLRAMDNASQAEMLRGADVYVFGFDVITDDFARLLCAVDAVCARLRVYLVMDRENAPDGDCFEPVRDSAQRLRERFRALGRAREWLWEQNAPLDAPPDIAFLERRLLCGAGETYEAVPTGVTLYAAPTPYAEAQWIAQRIALMLEEGVSPGDICVLCGDIKRYAPVFEAAFRAWRIPYYLAVKRSSLEHGAPRLLLSALRAVAGGFRREDVIDMVKSGFAPVSREDGWALENYALKYGIRGKRWHQPFTRGGEEERQAPERAREALSKALVRLQTALRQARDGAGSLKALVDFLTDCGAYEKLLAQEDALMHAGLYEQAARARQVWERLLALFEQLYTVADGARVPGASMAAWLEAGLSADAISALPPASGCVTVGALGNVICFEPRAVFACGLHSGMNEGGESGLLTQEERQDASEKLRAYLGMSEGERDLLGEIDLWKAFSAPTGHLYLSHAQATQDGAALRPAQAVSAVKRLLPRLVEEGGVSESAGASQPLAPLPALDALGARLRAGTLAGEWLDAYKWLTQSDAYRPMALSLLSAAQGNAPEETLPPALARALFTDRVMSVSRLESYAACPYSHFVEYGLRPQKREKWEINASDTGVFYHAAMEGFTRALSQHPAWPNITRKACDQLMESALRPLTEQWRDMAMGDSARAQAEGRRYTSVCRRVAWAFTQGAKHSDFRVGASEVAFGYPGGPPPLELRLEDGARVYVRGRIDRVDRLDTGESVYLRVVDYKSGSLALDPARVWMGTQLQLLLYLEAALQAERGALPAGAFYQWMGEPMISDDKKESVEREIAKKLCLKGVTLSDAEILQRMDCATPPVSMEEVLKKDGTPKQGKMACSMEEMHRLLRLAHGIAEKLTKELRSGAIPAAPVVGKGRDDACARCDFAGVCRRDARDGLRDRPLPDVDFASLLRRADAAAGKDNMNKK